MNTFWSMGHTSLVIFILFIVAGIWDFGCCVFGADNAGSTISATMVRLGFRAPFSVLVIGMIIGHLFFYMSPTVVTGQCDLAKYPENNILLGDNSYFSICGDGSMYLGGNFILKDPKMVDISKLFYQSCSSAAGQRTNAPIIINAPGFKAKE